MTHRTTARVVGALFITATVSFSLAVVLLQPVVGAPDYLTNASLHADLVVTGALLEFINHVTVVGIAVAIYPVLRRFSERLALAYVAARTIEAVLFTIGTMLLLTLVPVSREFVSSAASEAARLQTLGTLVAAGHDWDRAALAFAVFSLGALMLNYVLYRAKLVPRWLAAWGLAAAGLYLAAQVMVLYGIEPASTTQLLLDAPIGVQEMVLAVWLIVRGFNEAAFTSEGEVDSGQHLTV